MVEDEDNGTLERDVLQTYDFNAPKIDAHGKPENRNDNFADHLVSEDSKLLATGEE